MKLTTTKKLFTFPKYPLKKSTKSAKKFIFSYKKFEKPKSDTKFITSLNKNKKVTKEKQIKTISPKINPFNKKSCNLIKQKKRKIYNPLSSKAQNINFNFCKIHNFCDNYFDDDLSELNNFIPTIETESNRHLKNNEFNLDELYNVFKNSELKSTIIMDNCGNNNLNLEQKRFIEDYFDKKKVLENNIKNCKINTIKVEKYHCNNIFKKESNSQLQNSNKLHFKNLKLNNIQSKPIKKKIQIPFGILGKESRYPAGRKILSMKENLIIKNLLEKKNEEEKNEKDIIICNDDDNDEELKDNNSIFEDYMNKSADSSFINSSEGEDLVMAIQASVL